MDVYGLKKRHTKIFNQYKLSKIILPIDLWQENSIIYNMVLLKIVYK